MRKHLLLILSIMLLGQQSASASTLYNQIPDMQANICIQLVSGKTIPTVFRDLQWNVAYDLPMLSEADQRNLTAVLILGAINKYCPQFQTDLNKLVNSTQ